MSGNSSYLNGEGGSRRQGLKRRVLRFGLRTDGRGVETTVNGYPVALTATVPPSPLRYEQ